MLDEKSPLNIILDPILLSGTRENLSSNKMIEAMISHLIPKCLIITPNLEELNCLAPGLNEQSAVSSLNCPWTLVTTSDSSEVEVEHRLYYFGSCIRKFFYKKLPGTYHGSGCTLSSAISALIARGLAIDDACDQALDYTYQCLLNAKKLGKMQYHPKRFSYKSK